MYFEIQRIAALVQRAQEFHAGTNPFGAQPLYLQRELAEALATMDIGSAPEAVAAALRSGEVVGPAAARWREEIGRWLSRECARDALR